MAYVGVAMPVIKPETGAGIILGKAVGVDIDPQYSEASLYGDNEKAEYDKNFKSAKLKLETTTLPVKAHNVLFGHTVTEATEEKEAVIVSRASDAANYVGFGIYTEEKVNGKSMFVAVWLPRSKFSEPANNWTTKGENIEYKTPSIEGEGLADATGTWKETHIFKTEREAQAFLIEKAGVEDTDPFYKKGDTSGTTEQQ